MLMTGGNKLQRLMVGVGYVFHAYHSLFGIWATSLFSTLKSLFFSRLSQSKIPIHRNMNLIQFIFINMRHQHWGQHYYGFRLVIYRL